MGKPQFPLPGSSVIDASPLASTIGVVGEAQPAGAVKGAEPLAPAALAASTRSSSGSPGDGPLRRIGRYVLLRVIGEGGMGVVYAAYDEDLDRKVAVKLLHPSHQGDRDLRQRIVREAQALARVSAPNVVHVYEVGDIDDQMFIAMEFVNGTTLTRWQSAEPRTWQQTLRMYVAAGQGLLAAHEVGLTHRDFKPDKGAPRAPDRQSIRSGGKSLGTPGFPAGGYAACGAHDPAGRAGEACMATRMLIFWMNRCPWIATVHPR